MLLGMYSLAALLQVKILRGMSNSLSFDPQRCWLWSYTPVVGRVSEAPPAIRCHKQKGLLSEKAFLLVTVQHLDDVVTKLGVQRAGRLQHRAGEHHFIKRRHHRTLLEFAQMTAFFA